MSGAAAADADSVSSTGQPPSTSSSSNRRFNKACDACHTSKVRCVPEPLSPGSCKRCARNEIACTYTPLGPRRKPTRTKNERIAELERRVLDMQLMLQHKNSPPAAVGHDAKAGPGEGDSGSDAVATPLTSGPERTSIDTPSYVTDPSTPSTSSLGLVPTETIRPEGDVVDRGILSASRADRLVDAFRAQLEGQLLSTSLGSRLKPAELRRTKPILWLSVLSAASSGSECDVDLAETLHVEMERVFEEKLGDEDVPPSLEVIQALHNWMFYHFEPTHPKQRQFMFYSRQAINMVLALGYSSKLYQLDEDDLDIDALDEETLDICRELLVWYWGSFVITMKVRQPLMLRYNNLVKRSVKIISRSTLTNDMCMIQWVKLARIAQDTVTTLYRHFISPHGLDGEFRDQLLRNFEDRTQQWILDCPLEAMTEQLMIEYHTYIITIAEVYFPEGRHSMFEFERRNHGLPPLDKPYKVDVNHHLLDPWKFEYTKKCIHSAHAVLDIFVNLESRQIRRLANVCFGRAFYSLRFLLLLCHQVWVHRASHLISLESLKIEAHINDLGHALNRAAEGGKYKVSAIWLYALKSRVIPWYAEFCRRYEQEPSGPETQMGSPRETPSSTESTETPGTLVLDATLPSCPVFTNPIASNPPLIPPTQNIADEPMGNPVMMQPSHMQEFLASAMDGTLQTQVHQRDYTAPLDTFDPAAFFPNDLESLSSGHHAAISAGIPETGNMDLDQLGIGFGDLYTMLSPSLSSSWEAQAQWQRRDNAR